jgi:hypothetical protein
MDARKRVDELLTRCGAVLKRATKHQVWLLPNGKNFVRAQTPSDANSDLNNLSDLRRQLGDTASVQRAAPPKARLRRAKPVRRTPERLKSNVASLSLAESLRMAGITDDTMRERLNELETRMCVIERETAYTRRELAEMKSELQRSWLYRLQRWYEQKFT